MPSRDEPPGRAEARVTMQASRDSEIRVALEMIAQLVQDMLGWLKTSRRKEAVFSTASFLPGLTGRRSRSYRKLLG